MRSGQYIRALGRQSFEPSSPSAQPPASSQSQSRQRSLIAAQNDVLATVGVCLRETKHSLEASESLMAENEAGLVVGALDLTTTYLASWPLVGIRNRLQTYRGGGGFDGGQGSYTEVLRLAWERGGARLWAGVPAHLVYQLANVARDHVQSRMFAWLARRRWFLDPETRKPRNRRALKILGRCVSFASWFLIYPLFHHSNLQTLDLLPPQPLFPPLRSFLPFTAASPISLPPLSALTSPTTLITTAAGSFFVQSYILQSVAVTLQYIFFKRLLRILPTPAYAHTNTHTPHSPAAVVAAEHAIEITEADAGGERVHRATVHLDPDTGAPVPAGSAAPAPNEMYVDPDADADADMDAREAAAARALVAILEPDRAPTPPPVPAPAPAPRRRSQHYRSTTLSSHPVDVVASHLADCLAGSVLLVAETVVMRSLARSVLMARGVSVAGVYAPFEYGYGKEMVAKAMMGELGLMWALFEITWAASTAVGVRWFGYGYRK
ncbi:hypothetical protein EDC01DRAFT_670502 [Geopyxis carbonaria]|nr:hypothetical protein EDC01DRAFT_670502 [Geopyxis carbonaria]